MYATVHMHSMQRVSLLGCVYVWFIYMKRRLRYECDYCWQRLISVHICIGIHLMYVLARLVDSLELSQDIWRKNTVTTQLGV